VTPRAFDDQLAAVLVDQDRPSLEALWVVGDRSDVDLPCSAVRLADLAGEEKVRSVGQSTTSTE
jgi:hypothetical protein